MRRIVTPQIRVVEEEDGRAFQHHLNRAFKELSQEEGFHFELRDRAKGHCAYITWVEVEEIPETVKEIAHQKGIRYQCKDCPYIKIPKDRRLKWCECPFGACTKNDEACDWFYKEVAKGSVKPRENYEDDN